MFQVVRTDRVSGPVIRQKSICFEDAEESVELEYLTFDSLEKTGIVEHLFTTRIGGVSKGIFSSMNLSFVRGDDSQAVNKNYERIARIMQCTPGDIVASHQTHTTNIRKITAEDKGKGVTVARDYENIDGLITNEKGIALATFFADCVPIYLLDPVNKAIGLAHSGWRGTVQEMGACLVRSMQQEFGTNPENLLAAIGPSICQECYEVSEEVAIAFDKLLSDEAAQMAKKEIIEAGYYAHSDGANREVLEPGKVPGKYQLDLWLANIIILRKAGIPLAQIEVTDICTCHNPDYLFSHRASEGKRGNLGAFLMLKNDR